MTTSGAFSFELEAQSGRARAGRLRTPHGDVLTPCFMPVGTKASVKAVLPPTLHALGAQVVLANTYIFTCDRASRWCAPTVGCTAS